MRGDSPVWSHGTANSLAGLLIDRRLVVTTRIPPHIDSARDGTDRAEEERIKEAKRKRLIAKAEERRKNLARFLEAQKEQRERFRCVVAWG